MRSLGVLGIAFMGACMLPLPGGGGMAPAPGPRQPVGRTLTLPGPPALVLEADWSFDGTRYCVSHGDVAVQTPVGAITLYEADLCVTLSPQSLAGEARVPFPGVGLFSRLGISTDAPRGRLALGRGRDLGSIALGGQAMATNPEHWYLTVDYSSAYQVALGRVSVTTSNGAARMVIDPQDPTFYLAGSADGLLPAGIHDVVFGFSAAGRLPYASKNRLYDGKELAERRLNGHLFVQGTVPIGDYPISVSGKLVADVDADGDGRTLFDGASDLALAGDASLRVGYDRGGFNLRVDVADASFLYDRRPGAAGGFFFAGVVPAKFLAGTPLAGFEPTGATVELYGVYHAADDFSLLVRGDARIAGIPLMGAELALGAGGVRLGGRADLPGIGVVDVTGSMSADGRFALSGSAEVAIGGVKLSPARVSLSPAGVEVAGTTRFAGSSFAVSGRVTAGGEVTLAGETTVNAGAVRGTARLELGTRGASVSFRGRACAGAACVDLPGVEIDSQGRVCPVFPLVGKRCLQAL